jgi:hypothetical protein
VDSALAAVAAIRNDARVLDRPEFESPQKQQRPDFCSDRCHETPLKAPRESEVSARYVVFFIFFFFVGFVGVVAMTLFLL